jgi:hypothetical protein
MPITQPVMLDDVKRVAANPQRIASSGCRAAI